jgi:hypothetical protein
VQPHLLALFFMATSDPRPVTAPPASDLPDRPPPARPPSTTRPAPGAAGAPILDEGHQLPVHKGKVGRVTDHVKGAADNLTDWFELRIALLKREVKDEIDTVKRQVQELAKAYGAVAVFAIVALLAAFFMGGFMFVALCSIWLTLSLSLFLGWFVYTVLFAIATLVLLRRAKKKQKTLPLFSKEQPEPVTGEAAATPNAPPPTS